MVALLLATALLLQQQVEVGAQVDRQEVTVGEEIVLTITVEAHAGRGPVEINDPDLTGLELRNSRDQTRVSMQGGAATRITTRRITLHALRPGTATIGPVRVRQGEESAETEPIDIRVRAPASDAGAGLEDAIDALVRSAPAPRLSPDEATLSVLLSSESVVLGSQVDLVVVAWFPREVRSRLRNPPTLQAPALRGAWTYDRPAPTGIVASRQVGGAWYDLFALHEVVFPLAAGATEIGSATVSYSLPVSSSFLSRELRHEVQSEPFEIAVAAQPRAGVGSGYQGAAGRALDFRVDVPPGELRLGDAAMVYATLSGRGNVALWPEPALDWPVGLRAYPQEVAVDLNSEGGLVGGSKTFAYMVVADSAGTHRVPAPRYTYFDVASSRYVELRVAPIEFVTPSRRAGLTPVETVQPLVAAAPYSAEGLLAGVPLWGWILVVLLPPLIVLAMRLEVHVPRRVPRRPKADQGAGSGAGLQPLEAEFRGVLEGLVPAARYKAAEGLAAALRAAGVEASLAAHAARVRDRLRQALYGPEGSTDPEELTAEVQEVLRALIGGTGRVRSASLLVLLLLCSAAGAAGAQSAEQLYDAGAVRPAADSFAYRAAQDPLTAAHWYNLGAALNRLGENVRARAAWLRAARLAPRDETITRALAGTTPPDASPRSFIWVSPVTAAEAFLIAAALWMFAWFLLAARVRLRHVVPLLLFAVLAAAYGNAVTKRYARPLALVMLDETPLRAAPFGSAEAARELGRGVAVLIEEERGPWVLATDGVRRGWLLRTEVVQP